jgi:hypothetical protein
VKLTFLRHFYANTGTGADKDAGKDAGSFASVYLDTSEPATDRTIVRAVTGTDAELFIVPAGEARLRDDIGALLRYPVPGA